MARPGLGVVLSPLLPGTSHRFQIIENGTYCEYANLCRGGGKWRLGCRRSSVIVLAWPFTLTHAICDFVFLQVAVLLFLLVLGMSAMSAYPTKKKAKVATPAKKTTTDAEPVRRSARLRRKQPRRED